jgi:antitoxin component YwqK of YwqJK toxin-antitoxin module
MLGYKAAKNGDRRVVITLEIPEDALSNIERTSVKFKETAQYRANKVKVLKIEDSEGKEYDTAETAFFSKKILVYKVGEVLEEPTYDMDVEQVCSRGLHFFLERKVSEQFGIDKITNGLLVSFHENGQKYYEAVYKNGNIEGSYQYWYENGQKSCEGMYKNGKLDGIWLGWYTNGQKVCEGIYKGGKKVGEWKSWSNEGVLTTEDHGEGADA